jgi:hypothetical protein
MTSTNPWAERVAATDWREVASEVDSVGGALTPQLLTTAEGRPRVPRRGLTPETFIPPEVREL